MIMGAMLTLFCGMVSKQLQDIKKSRKRHQEAYAESMRKLEETAQSVSALTKVVEESQMRASRYRIIRFDDEEQNGAYHSDDHWDQIIEDVDIYEAFTIAHPDFINGKGRAAMHRIKTANMNGRNRNNI